MKLFRFALNIWITIASIVSFLVGWVALAHSPKPVQPSSQSAPISQSVLPTLTPLDNLQFGGDGNSGFQSFQAPSAGFSSMPRPIFRSSGS